MAYRRNYWGKNIDCKNMINSFDFVILSPKHGKKVTVEVEGCKVLTKATLKTGKLK